MTVQNCLSVIQTLADGGLPEASVLSSFIDACAPAAFSGPVPAEAAQMEASFLAEAGLENPPDPAVSRKVTEPLSDDEAHFVREELFGRARSRAQEHFGNRIYIRGLIEISNIC